jgi:hypothetical protein
MFVPRQRQLIAEGFSMSMSSCQPDRVWQAPTWPNLPSSDMTPTGDASLQQRATRVSSCSHDTCYSASTLADMQVILLLTGATNAELFSSVSCPIFGHDRFS